MTETLPFGSEADPPGEKEEDRKTLQEPCDGMQFLLARSKPSAVTLSRKTCWESEKNISASPNAFEEACWKAPDSGSLKVIKALAMGSPFSFATKTLNAEEEGPFSLNATASPVKTIFFLSKEYFEGREPNETSATAFFGKPSNRAIPFFVISVNS